MNYDAFIVGFGPVGATLANLLLRHGLRVAVIEAEAQIYDKPRAITHDHEVMRVYQACGLAHLIEPFTAPHLGTHYLGIDGRIIKIFDPAPPPHPLAWTPTGTFVQPEVERLLRAAVTTDDNATVLLRHRAMDFAQNDDGVTLAALDLNTQEQRTLRASFLLACDGANSFVRKQLDIPIDDLAFDEWWMVVDAHIDADLELPPRSIQYCWPERPATYVKGPGNLRRWEIKLLPGEDPDAFGVEENVVKQIARFTDTTRLRIWRSAVYRFHALLAREWRRGRVFLLGDACHQTPPFLGQGLCAGIRDAANLSWKLASYLRHGAPDPLLDTYEVERKPHVRTLVATAKEFGKIIGELDHDAAGARDDLLRGQLERGEAQTIRQRFIPNLAHGVIDKAPDAIAAGALFVQPWVRPRLADSSQGSEKRLEDFLAPCFLIVVADIQSLTGMTQVSLAQWKRISAEMIAVGSQDSPRHATLPLNCRQFIEREGLFASWLASHGAMAAVVRPDRYVYGMAVDDDQLNRLVMDVSIIVLGECAGVG